MVTAWKTNGKPRRTVDMPALNEYGLRETHHTQSPFHQATNAGTFWDPEVDHQCLELVSQCANPRKRMSSQYVQIPHGVGTDMKPVHRATLRQRTSTPEDSTRLTKTFLTKPNPSIAHAYGQTLSKKTFFKHVAG